jgi:DNA-binding transcriptional regulator YdaS (Cro superfamily)
MELNGIKKAIECLGSQSALAQALDVSPQFICQLANGSRPVPAKLVRKIETATAGQVTCHDLRPDIFGELGAQSTQVA